eukprot:338781_1
MGNIQASPGVDKSDLIQLFALELPFDTQFERQLGQGKILKTAKVKSISRDGHLVMKVYVKPILNQSNQQQMEKLEEDIDKYHRKYYAIQSRWSLDTQPGLIPLIPIENKDKTQAHLHRGYFLGRQYFTYNLLDRFNTVPYLTHIEKKWIVYQLLRCIKQAHATKIVHGDIKSENVLLTSWGWCFLTDFNPYKPESIPFDDPFQWSQYFEDSRRPRCYLAPERFYTGKNDGSTAALLPASDIFSLGCVVAEIFMDGQVLFDLSHLLKYKTHGFDQYDPTKLLAKKVDDKNVRELIEHCINLDPKSRWTPQQYLDFYKGKIFPPYFDDLYELFKKFLNVSFSEADHKIKYLQKKYVDILRMVSTKTNDKKDKYNFNQCVPELFRKEAKTRNNNVNPSASNISLSPNPSGNPATNPCSPVPKLEMIMRQQKQKQKQMKQENSRQDPQNNAGTDNDEFIRLKDYDDEGEGYKDPTQTRPTKLSGIGLALQTQRNSTTLPQPQPPTAKQQSLSRRGSRRRRSSGISQGLASVVSAAYKGSDTRLLNDEDIEQLTERLNTMTSIGDTVKFINKNGNLVVDMQSYGGTPSTNSKPKTQATAAKLYRKPSLGMHSKMEDKRRRMIEMIDEGGAEDENAIMVRDIWKSDDDENEFEGLILVSNVVCSALRNCRKASNRLIALEIIGGFAEYLNDEIRLDRLVPYVRALIHDDKKKIHEEHCVVVAKAIEVMSDILGRVIHVPSKYTRLFPDYIVETLKLLVDNRKEEIIRIEIARQLANLALTGKYFIDYRDKDREISNLMSEGGDVAGASSRSTLSNDLYKLRSKVSQLIDPLFGVDQFPSVQRALLSNCTRLCQFLGAKFTESKLIPGLFTFFNRKEWQLRVSFLDVVVGISFYIGKESLHKVLLPCLEECLNDARPAVVERCLEAFISLTEMKIFDSQLLLSRIQQIVPLVVHYSAWVRNTCVNFLLSAAAMLGDVRAHCRMLPLLEPYLEYQIVFINRETLTAALKPPLSRSTFTFLISNYKNLDVMNSIPPQLYADQPLYDGILSYIGGIKYYDDTAAKMSLNDVKPPRLYSILIEPTVPPQILSPLDHDHDESRTNGDSKNESTDSAWHELNESIWSIAGHSDVTKLSSHRDRHPRQVDDKKIREALELPMAIENSCSSDNSAITWDEFKLRASQISHCSFYKNHQPPFRSLSIDPCGWKPRGRVITQLTEHEDSVNVMRVSRDNLFVATASNDSTVKIWSCDKMHSHASIKSEQTYSHQKGEIISLAILDSTHTIASGSRDGTIHCFRVAYHDDADAFAGLVYKFTLDPEEGGVVSMEHFNTLSESLIMFGTQAGNIHGWDIRRKKLSFALPMEPAMGAITSMAIGPSTHSVIVGTARGFIVLFDLRFEFPVQMWRHYDTSPIVSITVIDSKTIINHIALPDLSHPAKGPLVLISTQRSNEICAFDLTTGTCRVRFRNSMKSMPKSLNKKGLFSSIFSSTKTSGNTQLGLKISQLPSVYPAALGKCPATRPFSLPSFEASTILQKKKKKEEEEEEFESCHANRMKFSSSSSSRGYVYNCGFVPTVLNRALNVNVIGDELEQLCSNFGNEHGGSTGLLISKEQFVITAGRDRVVRYWDLAEPQKSYRLSNPAPNTIFTYNAYQDKKYNEAVFEELIEFEQEDYCADQNHDAHTQIKINKIKNSKVQDSKSLHQDIITDCKAIQYPQKMLLTSSRNGIVKVWI